MKLTYLTTTIIALGLITGCSQAQTTANNVDDVAAVTVQKTSQAAENGVNKVRALSKDGVKGKPSRPGVDVSTCLLYTSPSPRDRQKSRMPSSA